MRFKFDIAICWTQVIEGDRIRHGFCRIPSDRNPDRISSEPDEIRHGSDRKRSDHLTWEDIFFSSYDEISSAKKFYDHIDSLKIWVEVPITCNSHHETPRTQWKKEILWIFCCCYVESSCCLFCWQRQINKARRRSSGSFIVIFSWANIFNLFLLIDIKCQNRFMFVQFKNLIEWNQHLILIDQ